MGQGSGGIGSYDLFEATYDIPTLNRLMKHPVLAPLYFKQIKRLADTVFSPAQLNPTLDHILGEVVPQGTINTMKAYAASRVAYLLSQIPLNLSINSTLPTNNGYAFTSVSPVYLSGLANAIDTRSVKVNGEDATWSAWEGKWSVASMALNPGINQVVVQAFDESGREVERATTDIWYTLNTATSIAGGNLTTNAEWSTNSSPYQVTGNLTIPAGITLSIQPGTTVFFDPNVNLTVANGGRLLAEGTAAAPIYFTRTPSSNSTWGGLIIKGNGNSPETRLAYTHLDFNGTTNIHAAGSTLFVDHVTFGSTLHQYLALDDASFIVQNCIFPTPTAGFEPVHGTGGIKSGGHGLFLRNYFGAPNGYSDIIDFTGGNRPSEPLFNSSTTCSPAPATTSWTWTAPTPGSRGTSSCTSIKTDHPIPRAR